jgi:protein-S-isoprenylcysteine O-methyltransferase Ste14
MDNNKQMSLFGVGPKLAVITLAYSVIIYFVSSANKNLFEINIVSHTDLTVAGIVLLLFGLTLHVICGKTIVEIRKEDKLSTNGLYKMCRHPMYSVWIFFNIPAIALLIGSWLALTIPVFMYIIFRFFIRTEENYLKERYPQDYIEYKKNVNLVFPCLWRLVR